MLLVLLAAIFSITPYVIVIEQCGLSLCIVFRYARYGMERYKIGDKKNSSFAAGAAVAKLTTFAAGTAAANLTTLDTI